MNRQRTIETTSLGALEICLDPPMMFWEGLRLHGWRPNFVRLFAALIAGGISSPGDLSEQTGLAPGASMANVICEARKLLLISRLPLRIFSVMDPDQSRRLIGYRLEILA